MASLTSNTSRRPSRPDVVQPLAVGETTCCRADRLSSAPRFITSSLGLNHLVYFLVKPGPPSPIQPRRSALGAGGWPFSTPYISLLAHLRGTFYVSFACMHIHPSLVKQSLSAQCSSTSARSKAAKETARGTKKSSSSVPSIGHRCEQPRTSVRSPAVSRSSKRPQAPSLFLPLQLACLTMHLAQRLPVELIALTRATCYARPLSTSARRFAAPPPADSRVFVTTPIFYCNAGELKQQQRMKVLY